MRFGIIKKQRSRVRVVAPAFNPRVREAVRRHHRRGLNDVQIARRLRVSPSWVNRVRTGLGLARQHTPVRSWDPKAARRLHRAGWNDREIAQRLGLSRETVQKWRRAARLAPNGWHRTPRQHR